MAIGIIYNKIINNYVKLINPHYIISCIDIFIGSILSPNFSRFWFYKHW